MSVPFTETPCLCGGDICGLTKDDRPRKRRYRCKWCKRWVPWCFGAADDLPLHCDDCWVKAHKEDRNDGNDHRQ